MKAPTRPPSWTGQPNKVTWADIEAVYEAYDEVGDWDREPTDEEVEAVMERLGWHQFRQGGRRINGKVVHPSKAIRIYLSDRHTYSPWPDEVMVERAFNFDLRAIEGLTYREYQELLSRLAASPDPWGYGYKRHLHVPRSALQAEAQHSTPSNRLGAFQSLPEYLRARLHSAVTMRWTRDRRAAV